MKTLSKVSVLALGVAFATAGCDTTSEAPTGPRGPIGVSADVFIPLTGVPTPTTSPPDAAYFTDPAVLGLESVIVCKYGTDADFTYDVEDLSSNNADTNGSFSVTDGNCIKVVGADREGANVTITELVANLGAGEQFDRLDVTTLVEGGTAQTTTLLTPTATVNPHGSTGGIAREGAVLEFYNSFTPPPPPGGGEGCTPGYWKNHAGVHSHSKGGQKKPSSWEGYFPTDGYDATFGVTSDFGGSLIDALKRGGGGENALGRHAVAALLNAAHSGVSFDMTEAEVIALVQDAYANDTFEDAKDTLVALNEQGCPLGNGGI